MTYFSDYYWNRAQYKHQIITNWADLLKVHGQCVSGGKLLLACRAHEDGYTLLMAIIMNSTLSWCCNKNMTAPFVLCSKLCQNCSLGVTNHLDLHYLTTEAVARVLFAAVQQYDLLTQQRGHTTTSLRERLVKLGYEVTATTKIEDIPLKNFRAQRLGLNRDITLAVGAGKAHADDDNQVMKPKLVNYIKVNSNYYYYYYNNYY